MPPRRRPRPASPGRLLLLAATAALAPALLAAARPPAAAAQGSCSNAQLRIEDNSLSLPDCRAYELVSPADKNGGAIAAPGTLRGGGELQAAALGQAVTYGSAASFGEGAVGAPPASQYLSTRTGSGWTTQNITPPTLSGAYGDQPEGVPYRLFSPDLSRALMLDGRRCGPAEQCPRSYSLREAGGGLLAQTPAQLGLAFEGASANLGLLVFSDPSGLYAWSGAGLEAIDEVPGARLGAPALAVSADGGRIYFSAGGALFLREGQTNEPLPEAGAGASFQTASADGALAFFSVGTTLYRYSAQSQTSEPIATAVKGVLGASQDGSVLYYQTAAGLFRWDQGALTEIASGAGAAEESDWPPSSGTARVTADGQSLAFLSSEPLTGYDNRDAASGERDSEVFLWSPAAGLACVSCNPSGQRPLGPSRIPGALLNPTATPYKPRALSADGRRLFFQSTDKVLPTDGSAAADVYEWEAAGEGSCEAAAGCLFLISSGASAEASTFVDASESGADAFFLSGDSLLPTDPGSVDLYDARELGGFPVPHAPTPCEGDACQPIPSPPQDPSPGTLVSGPANPAPHYAKVGQKKKRKAKKRHRGGAHRRGGSK